MPTELQIKLTSERLKRIQQDLLMVATVMGKSYFPNLTVETCRQKSEEIRRAIESTYPGSPDDKEGSSNHAGWTALITSMILWANLMSLNARLGEIEPEQPPWTCPFCSAIVPMKEAADHAEQCVANLGTKPGH